ncbi:MAG: hypothetical protein J5861_07755 [Desulfovibrio sp.]|nr:hypothetical protein [Desulfovibrio sp.]
MHGVPCIRQEKTLEASKALIGKKPSTAGGRATYVWLSPIAHAAYRAKRSPTPCHAQQENNLDGAVPYSSPSGAGEAA